MGGVGRLVIAGVDAVLPDRIVERASLVVEQGVIVDLVEHERPWPAETAVVDGRDQYAVPGFVDVHVHGYGGIDVMDGPDAVRRVAAVLPTRGVTAFCPTSVACDRERLEQFLQAVTDARHHPEPGAARVLPAHLESNFVSPEYAGAQPVEFLLEPPAGDPRSWGGDSADVAAHPSDPASAILRLVERFRPDVGILTVAPELPRGLALVRWAVERGWTVSLGHSAASFDVAMDAIDAGARQATHLFNRMLPMTHRAPGLVGAILSSGAVTAELICDGHHLHPAVVRATVAAKGLHKVMAISDGTAGSGCAVGTMVRLGGRPIVVGAEACFLPDGRTLAGSRGAMDDAFRFLVGPVGLSPIQAAYLCSTSAARHLGMSGFGTLARGAPADMALLDRQFRVTRAMVAGQWAGRFA